MVRELRVRIEEGEREGVNDGAVCRHLRSLRASFSVARNFLPLSPSIDHSITHRFDIVEVNLQRPAVAVGDVLLWNRFF